MKKILFIFLAFSTTSAFAQGNLAALQYSIGFGTGDLGDYIGQPSFRSFTIDYRRLIQPKMGVGVDIGWNVFYDERPDDTYELGNLSLSGKQWRYNNQFPILVAADYYFQPGEKINPFAGFGMGIMFSNRKTDMGAYAFEQDAVNFTIRPEIGILYEFHSELSFKVSSKYYYGFEARDLPAQGYFTLNFGFVVTY